MLAPGWGTGTRGGSPPGVKLGSLLVPMASNAYKVADFRYPAGIAEDILVKIRGYFVPVDFVVLDMEFTKETPLILGQPFLASICTYDSMRSYF